MTKTATSTPQQLVAGCQGLVRTLAWKIHIKCPRSVELEDLVAYGQLGLVQAARDFDVSRGPQFTTYAFYRIRGAILDGLSKMCWFNQSDYYSGRYERMADDVLRVDGEQTAAAADQDENLRWFDRTTNGLAMVYLLSQARSGGQREDSDQFEDPGAPSPAAALMGSELVEKLHRSVDALPADAAGLIRAAYFEGLSLKEAGQRLGISKSWASRLHAKALNELARTLAGVE